MYGSGSGSIWLDNVQCYGFESDIRSCPHQGWGVYSCDHSQDVAISCFSTLSCKNDRGVDIVLSVYRSNRRLGSARGVLTS